MRLLVDAGGVRLDREEWLDLVPIAKFNNLSGYMLDIIDRSEDVPEGIRRYFREDYLTLVGMDIFAEQACAGAANALSAAGVPFAPLKGALFRYLLYPDPSMRPGVDIDILVPPGQMSGAERALLDAGFRRGEGWPGNRRASERTTYEKTYFHPDIRVSGCFVEIHDGYSRAIRYPVDYQDVWRRTVKMDDLRVNGETPSGSVHPFGSQARTLSPEDILVHLFIHNAKHLFSSTLLSFIDIRLIVERLTPDWDKVLERARSTLSTAVGYLTLKMAKEAFGADVPAEVLGALRPAGLRRIWLEYLVSSFPVPSIKHRDGPLRFFWLSESLALQQALLALPLIDGIVQPARFGLGYALLRARDLVEHWAGKYTKGCRDLPVNRRV
jgi:hypothetical protein